MNLKRLTINNFLAIGSAELDFANQGSGVRLIEGKNHDSPSSTSNGSGKSSIPESVQWALFGTTRRGLKGDGVINRKTGKNCLVALEFDDFILRRARKDDQWGTGLYLHQWDGSEWKDLTKGTVRETQELLESIIKFSEFTYSKVAYFGQGDIKGFAGLTDAELKKVFDQALGVTFFQEWLERAKAHRQSIESGMTAAQARHESALREALHVGEKIELIEKSIEEEKERTIAESGKAAQAAKEAEERKKVLIDMTAAQVFSIEATLKEFAGSENKRIELSKLDRQLREQINEASRQFYSADAGKTTIERALKGVEADLNSLHFKIGQACGECGKIYQEQDLEPARVQGASRLEKLRLEYDEALKFLHGAKAKLDKLNSLLKQLTGKMEELEPAKAKAAALRVQKANVETNLKRELDSLERIIAESQAKAALKPNDSRAQQDLAWQRQALERAKVEQAKALEDLERLRDEIHIAKLLEEAMGNGGLKSYIFDAITPELNKAIDHNIKILDDIDIEVSTVTQTDQRQLLFPYNDN